jgi:hypothetical protein
MQRSLINIIVDDLPLPQLDDITTGSIFPWGFDVFDGYRMIVVCALSCGIVASKFDNRECVKYCACNSSGSTLTTSVSIAAGPVAFGIANGPYSLIIEMVEISIQREEASKRTPEIMTTQNRAETQPVIAYRMIL